MIIRRNINEVEWWFGNIKTMWNNDSDKWKTGQIVIGK